MVKRRILISIVTALLVVCVTIGIIWSTSAKDRRLHWLRSLSVDGLSNLAQENPSDFDLVVVAVRRLESAGRTSDALSLAEKSLAGIAADDQSPDAYNIRIRAAILRARYGDIAFAIDTAKQLKDRANKVDRLLLDGEIALRIGKPDEARRDFDQAAGMNTGIKDGEIWSRAGAAAFASEMYPESVTDYRRAAELEPDAADLHAGLGAALQKTAKFVEARKEFDRAVSLVPANGSYRASNCECAAMAARSSEEYHAAVDWVKHEIKLQPDNIGLLATQAGLHRRFLNFAEAESVQQKYVEMAPQNEAGWLDLVDICRRSGDLRGEKSASAIFDRIHGASLNAHRLVQAVALSPANARLMLQCAYALHEAGRNSQAYNMLMEAAQTDPADPEISRAISTLKSGENAPGASR